MISFDIYVLCLGSDAITYWLLDTLWRRLHDEPEVAAVAVERQLLLRLSTLSEGSILWHYPFLSFTFLSGGCCY